MFVGALYLYPKESSNPDQPIVNNTLEKIGPDVYRDLKTVGDQVIFDYTFKVHQGTAFRDISIPKPDNPSSHLVLLGCSFTWGQGLRDEDTLHYQLHNRLRNFEIFNWSLRGTGPNTTLKTLDEIDFKTIQASDSGYTLYFLMGDHVGRVTGDLFHMVDMQDEPYYKLNSFGEVEYRGSFLEGRPFLTPLLRWASKTDWIRRWNVNYPSVHWESSKAQFCGVLKALHKKVQEKLPSSQFYFVLYPDEYATLEYREECLKPNGLPFIDAFHLINGKNREDYYFPHDGHPNRDLILLLADYLRDVL